MPRMSLERRFAAPTGEFGVHAFEIFSFRNRRAEQAATPRENPSVSHGPAHCRRLTPHPRGGTK